MTVRIVECDVSIVPMFLLSSQPSAMFDIIVLICRFKAILALGWRGPLVTLFRKSG
jgi:hypothetical protein